MTDTARLSLALDKTSYAKGQLMTATVSGTVTNSSGVPLTWTLKAITDLSGRVWTISADGKSATAKA